MKNKVTLLNIASSLLLQVVSVISGLIVPRIILSCFGSDINGLVSSINQFLSYITLIEGGITGVISANLYKPLIEKNWKQVSSVLKTARSFYRKIGAIFIVYTGIIAVIYPKIVITGYEDSYIFLLTIILSIGLLLQYMFSLTMTTLLNADKKVYIVSFASIVLTLGNIISVMVITNLYPDIIALKFCSAALYVLKPVVLGRYIRKRYDINWTTPKDYALIQQRWNGFAINFAFFIHTSTDITILTLFSDLETVSVYSVYYLIVSKMSVLIHSLASGIEPTIGQAYAKNDLKELHQKLDLYEFIIFFSVGFLFTVTAMLIAPFVMIYTKGITDTDYYQPIFGAMLVFSEALYLLKYPHVTLSYVANKFKEITIPAFIEALINIIVSIVLVQKLGLIGVAIGTATGMLYRMLFHVYFTSRLIPGRRQRIFYIKLLVITGATVIGILIGCSMFPLSDLSLANWLLHAIIYCFIFGVIYFVMSKIFFGKEINYFIAYIKRKL